MGAMGKVAVSYILIRRVGGRWIAQRLTCFGQSAIQHRKIGGSKAQFATGQKSVESMTTAFLYPALSINSSVLQQPATQFVEVASSRSLLNFKFFLPMTCIRLGKYESDRGLTNCLTASGTGTPPASHDLSGWN